MGSLSEYTLEIETLCTRKNRFWTNLLERWKVMNRKQLRLDSTLFMTQTIHNNPLLTIDPIQITSNAQYIPLGSVIDHNFKLLPLHIIKRKYTNVRITFLQHQQLKLNTQLIRSNLKQINDFNDSRRRIDRSGSIHGCTASFPCISFQHYFLITNPKGCKAFREKMNKQYFDTSIWNSFSKHQANFGELNREEMEQIAANSAQGNTLMHAKDLQYLVLRNQFLNNSRLYTMKLINSPNCKICVNTKDTNIHHFYECAMAKPIWIKVSDILNEIGIYIYIDAAASILNCQVPSNDIRRIIINFVRLEIRNAKLFEYILTECMVIKRLTTLASIFKELKFQSSIWANLFYYLSGLQIRKRVFPRINYNGKFPDGQERAH